METSTSPLLRRWSDVQVDMLKERGTRKRWNCRHERTHATPDYLLTGYSGTGNCWWAAPPSPTQLKSTPNIHEWGNYEYVLSNYVYRTTSRNCQCSNSTHPLTWLTWPHRFTLLALKVWYIHSLLPPPFYVLLLPAPPSILRSPPPCDITWPHISPLGSHIANHMHHVTLLPARARVFAPPSTAVMHEDRQRGRKGDRETKEGGKARSRD